MQLPRRGRRHRSDELLPLINIIFLLLIFFMLAGTMAAPEAFPVQPPDSRSEATGNTRAELLIGASGELAWHGEPITLSRLGRQLRAQPSPRLLVRADGAITSEKLMPVLAELRAAGVKRVSLITRHAP